MLKSQNNYLNYSKKWCNPFFLWYNINMNKKLEILYEDNHLIVVVKPFNVLSQKDKTKDVDMLTIVKDYIKVKYNKPGEVYLALLHRLDRPTMGIMIFAKTSKAAKRMSEQIKDYSVTKKYLTVVTGSVIPKQKTLEDYLLKDNDNTSKVVNKESGKLAILNYEVLKTKNNLSLLEVELITGRHHQIRVQLSNFGFPIYGDQRYNVQDKNQLALIAHYIKFKHPVTKEYLEFMINIPKEYPWSLFYKEV